MAAQAVCQILAGVFALVCVYMGNSVFIIIVNRMW